MPCFSRGITGSVLAARSGVNRNSGTAKTASQTATRGPTTRTFAAFSVLTPNHGSSVWMKPKSMTNNAARPPA